jgi:GAF domain-containing protein
MARLSKTGGKMSWAKGRKASPIKGSKAAKLRKRPAVSDPIDELKEAQAQHSAMAEILKIIASSQTDVDQVLNAIVESACKLCDAYDAGVVLRMGDDLHFSAHHGPIPTGTQARPLNRQWATGRSVVDKVPVQVSDFWAPEAAEFPEGQRQSREQGHRCTLSVPLLSEGEAVGAVVLRRLEPVAFNEKQVALLQTFADQAVIAIQNARLINETKEALERQTATADILKVIAGSPDDVQPVFDAIAHRSNRLVNGLSTAVYRLVGDMVHLMSFTPVNPSADAALQTAFPAPLSQLRWKEEIDPAEIAVVEDAELEFATRPVAQKLARLRGWRSWLGVPLLSDGTMMGFITVTRAEPGRFDDHDVQMLKTFADQAVIAISNVELFNEVQAKTRELTEALTYQTGSANILKVIASSPTDVGPVLKAIVESACELCESYDAILRLRESDILRFSAQHGTLATDHKERPINRNWTAGRAVLDLVPVHVHDMLSVEGDEFPEAKSRARTLGQRTFLSVPLLREGESIGVITLRRLEVNPFRAKQVTLLQTFADQAVIAIANARLFNEVQAKTQDLEEALRYQTGSANILSVIASSPTDVQPVLTAIVETACQLCEAYDAIVILKDGDDLEICAHHGPIPHNRTRWRNDLTTTSGRAMADRRPVHVRDMLSDEGLEFPTGRSMSSADGCRTLLSVPLLREGEPIGAIVLRRTDVYPFKDKQIALLQTFADQAVIAIGNVHLFEQVQARTHDLQESLQQQTATSEVLQVISSSSGELEPVFNKMLENATSVCGAEFGTMTLYEEGGFRTVALYNAPKPYADTQLYKVIRPHPESGLSAVQKTHQPIHIADIRNEAPYIEGNAHVRALADLGGARTLVIVPMLKENEFVGSITIYRQEVKPFTDKQTELVSNFANQAVIAIENARLLNELRERTQELSQSLDDLRAAQDRLVQTEKLASLGQLTAGIAHEIKNPLNFVNNFSALSVELTEELNDLLRQAALAEQLRKEVDEVTGLLKSNLEKVVQHGSRADSIVKNMLLHSREGSGELRAADINALVEESLNLAYHGARAEKSGFNITLRREFDASAGSAELFPQEITRALLNLISNGFYAATKRKAENDEREFEPVLSATTRNLGASVEIRIRDNGTGIPPEVKDKMFNPFFTTKPAGEGTGLGLSMTHDIIVKQHGGTIDIATEPGRFTEFIVTLPRAIAGQDSKRSRN